MGCILFIYSDCKKAGANSMPILSCNKDQLKIRWPTDIDFPADIASVPTNIRQSLESRIRSPLVTLDVVVLGAKPQ